MLLPILSEAKTRCYIANTKLSRAMQKIFLLNLVVFLFLLAGSNAKKAQGYTITLEEHATDLVEGQTTYRLYVDMVNADDFLSSVYGGDYAWFLSVTRRLAVQQWTLRK